MIAGYSALLRKDDGLYLDKLFVEPERIGIGCGKLLWLHAVAIARDLGIPELLLDSDPNAAPMAPISPDRRRPRAGWCP